MVCVSAQPRIPVLPRFFSVGCSALVRRSALGGVDLDSISERELERLRAGLVKLASMDDTVLAALIEQVLAGDELAPSS